MHIRRHQQPGAWPDATRGSPPASAAGDGQDHQRWAWPGTSTCTHDTTAQAVLPCCCSFWGDLDSPFLGTVAACGHCNRCLAACAMNFACVQLPAVAILLVFSFDDTCLQTCWTCFEFHEGHTGACSMITMGPTPPECLSLLCTQKFCDICHGASGCIWCVHFVLASKCRSPFIFFCLSSSAGLGRAVCSCAYAVPHTRSDCIPNHHGQGDGQCCLQAC